MDVDTALGNLFSLSYQTKDISQYIKLYTDAVSYLSNKDQDQILENYLTILREGKITIIVPPRNRHIAILECLPPRRLIVYRLLQKFDFTNAKLDIVEALNYKLIDRLNWDTDMSEVLKTLQHLYEQQTFFAARFYLIEAMQKASFHLDKRCEKMIRTVVNTILSKQFLENDRFVLINHLFDLANFGIVEYFMAACLFKMVKDIWVHSYVERSMRYIMDGFCDNNLAYGASVLFEAVLGSVNNEEVTTINSIIKKAFTGPPQKRSRTLTMSFEKYIVPICANKFGAALYTYSWDMDLFYRLIACKHMYIATGCFKERELLMVLIEKAARSTDRNISIMGFQLLCHFSSKRIPILIRDINLFKSLLISLPEMILGLRRCIRYFISQLTVMYYLSRTEEDRKTCLYFYSWLREFAYMNTAVEPCFAHIACEVYCFSIETVLRPSTELVTVYDAGIDYERNPLLPIIFANYGKDYHEIMWDIFKQYVETAKDLPFVHNVLVRLYFPSLRENVFHLMNGFFDVLRINEPWSNSKTLGFSSLIVKLMHSRNKHSIVGIMKEMVTRMIYERVWKFVNPRLEIDVVEFDVSTHVEVLTKIIKLTLLESNYVRQCETAAKQFLDIINTYNSYEKRDFNRHRYLKKGTERSVVALINQMFVAGKLADYKQEVIRDILNTCDRVINNASLKKVIITACRQFYEMIKVTPQFESKYIEFYNLQKAKYLQFETNLTLRKSAGIRNFMHSVLKVVKRLYFLENEINNFLTDNENDTVDQLTLKINLLESLVSDASLKVKTHQFIIPIFRRALQLLNNEAFMIKNASAQLISVICTRLLGPLTESGVRELSVMDVFTIYPELSVFISEQLYSPYSSDDVKAAILGFLTESNQNGNLYSHKCLFDITRLKLFFLEEMHCNYAIKAFIACCPKNKMYDILMRELLELNLYQDNIFQVTNEVELVKELTDCYIRIFPDSSTTVIVLYELNRILQIWNSNNFIDRHAVKLSYGLYRPQFISTSILEEQEEIASSDEYDQVNNEHLLVILEYISEFVVKIDDHLIKDLFKLLIGNENNITRRLVFSVRKIIGSINDSIRYIDNVKLINNKIDIYIQDIFITIVSSKDSLDKYDIEGVNRILDNSIVILLDYNERSKIHLIVNIVGKISRFLFTTEGIDIKKFLFILFVITYILNDDKRISTIYYFLTTYMTSPKVGLFLILNNLHLYLDDKILQKKLLRMLSNFINRPVDFNISSIYANPTDLTEKIHFQLKLNQNILYLLNN